VDEAEDQTSSQDLKVHRSQDRSMAAILIAAGRLSVDDSEQIKKRQAENHKQFGEVGKELGLISPADVNFALSRQFEYPFPVLQNSLVSKEVGVAHRPYSDQAEAMRGIRSRLLLNWLSPASEIGKALAIVSPSRGEGRSWVTANLAVLFAQLGERTLIIDADLRRPSQHALFGLPNQTGLSGVIAGLAGLEAIQQLPDFPDLAVLPAGVIPPNPQELLSRHEFGVLLQRLRHSFDVIVIDTPALSEVADAETVSARAGSALFVARRNKSKVGLLDHYCSLLQRSSVALAGSVMLG
jgi:protein-tyrosine kinase